LHARSGLESSTIDLVFSTTVQIIISTGKHLIADHLPIFISFSSKDRKNNKKNPKCRKITKHKKIKYSHLNSDLAQVPWERLIEMTEVDDMVEFFTKNVNEFVTKHAAVITLNLNKSKSYTFLTKSTKKDNV